MDVSRFRSLYLSLISVSRWIIPTGCLNHPTQSHQSLLNSSNILACYKQHHCSSTNEGFKAQRKGEKKNQKTARGRENCSKWNARDLPCYFHTLPPSILTTNKEVGILTPFASEEAGLTLTER
jgi:hypothetical protein